MYINKYFAISSATTMYIEVIKRIAFLRRLLEVTYYYKQGLIPTLSYSKPYSEY